MYGKTNEQESFEENLAINMKFLHDYIEFCSNREFAKSLYDWYVNHGDLTPKQLYRAVQFFNEAKEKSGAEPDYDNSHPLMVQAKATSTKTTTPIIVPANPPRVAINPDAIGLLYNRFDIAKTKLQFPKIVIKLPDVPVVQGVSEVCFYIGGDKSKYKDNIIVWNNDRNNYMLLAVLFRDKTFKWGTKNLSAPLQQFIKTCIENTVEVTAIAGKRTCQCCYCGLPLTNEISVSNGYGPICAQNWGLPWEKLPVVLEDLA